jgi:hypothetical protein
MQVYALDANGNVAVTVNGRTGLGFIDSGSNAYFFSSIGINSCHVNSGFYCPSVSSNVQLEIVSGGVSSGPMSVTVANADALFQSNNIALPGIAGITTGNTDLGLPFFFGKSIAFGLQGTTINSNYYPHGFVSF